MRRYNNRLDGKKNNESGNDDDNDNNCGFLQQQQQQQNITLPDIPNFEQNNVQSEISNFSYLI